MTATEARANLSSVLKRALKGDDVGIVVGGRIVALRPMEVVSRDYAEREYGLSRKQMKTISSKLHEKAEKNVRTGKSKTFKDALLKD